MAIGGIDIGGTKIGACVGRDDGTVLASETFGFDGSASPGDVLERGRALLERLAHDAGETIERIGIAVPGPFDSDAGRFLRPPNMTRWHGFELDSWARAQLGVPARAMNDANAAGAAEWRWGGHGDVGSLVFLTCSTGLGAGIVIGGRVVEGARGLGGEVGRIRLSDEGPMGFGVAGTVEGFGSGTGLAQLGEQERLRAAQTGEASALHGLAGALDARVLCTHAAAGDPASLRAVRRCARGIGRLVAILGNVLAPDVVVLGTIPTAYPGLFLDAIAEAARAETTEDIFESMRIATTRLDDRWQRQALAAAL